MSASHTQPIHSQVGHDLDPQLSFTVHEYQKSTCAQVSLQSTLKQGYEIIRLALHNDAMWEYIEDHAVQDAGVERSNKYVFNMAPPMSISSIGMPQELKEWGSEVTHDEIFTLETLDEFQNCDLRYIFQKVGQPRTITSTPDVNVEERKVEASLVEPEVRTKQLKTGSLFRIIPQPHLYTTPSHPKKRTVNSQYTRCKPTYIAPYTAETYPKDARVGWIIPLRGSVPWDNCTSGEILDNVAVPSPVQLGTKAQISWTEKAILEFWHYLLRLYKKGTLGRLAISFQASKNHKQVSETSNAAFNSSKGTSTSNSRHLCHGLSAVDFIKIYQDALDAPYVRNAIDVFRYQCTQENGTMQQIRLLKGSKLALVDELSQGILVL